MTPDPEFHHRGHRGHGGRKERGSDPDPNPSLSPIRLCDLCALCGEIWGRLAGDVAIGTGLVVLLTIFVPAASQAAGSKPEPARSPRVSPLLPKIDGWRLSDGPTRYTPETLFEYIDGGAESFLQFDFQELASATYVSDEVHHGKNRESSGTSPATITVDIYRHRDAMRAFGMYTQERPAGTTPLPIGIEGYGGRDYLEFVVGSTYVKLVQSGAQEPAALRRFAERVAAGLPGTREAPSVLRCFPERGKRVRAEKFAARDFLGHPFLHDAVAVPYQIGAANFRLFVVEGHDSADLRAMVTRYRAVEKSSDSAGEVGPAGTATVKDPLNGEVVLHWKGRWLWGAVDQPCAERKALIDELGRSLSE